tara:strand:- start:158 stop:358 length:201 start_codon:yes stop_codon:yes gene_type:complete
LIQAIFGYLKIFGKSMANVNSSRDIQMSIDKTKPYIIILVNKQIMVDKMPKALLEDKLLVMYKLCI